MPPKRYPPQQLFNACHHQISIEDVRQILYTLSQESDLAAQRIMEHMVDRETCGTDEEGRSREVTAVRTGTEDGNMFPSKAELQAKKRGRPPGVRDAKPRQRRVASAQNSCRSRRRPIQVHRRPHARTQARARAHERMHEERACLHGLPDSIQTVTKQGLTDSRRRKSCHS